MYQALGLKAEDITWDSLEFGKLANIKVIENRTIICSIRSRKEQAKHQKKTEEKVDEVRKSKKLLSMILLKYHRLLVK